jgi:hypothetical protein
MSSNEYPQFSDFATEDKPLDGEKRKLDDILNIEILITGFKVGKSKYRDKNYLTLQVEIDNDKYVLFTGSAVLTNQVQKYMEKIPFYTKIKKIKNYSIMT